MRVKSLDFTVPVPTGTPRGIKVKITNAGFGIAEPWAADSPASDWASPAESGSLEAMTTRADDYLHKAEEFEAMAQRAKAETAKAVYEHLAWCYRQLGIHAGRTSRKDIDLDELAERMVGRKAP